MDDRRDALREQAWDGAFHSFGTAHIFDRRARRLRLKTRILAFASLAVPLLIGGALLGGGNLLGYFSPVATVASILMVVQLIVAAWAVVADWTGALTYAIESTAENHALSEAFHRLASNPPVEADALEHDLELLTVADQGRRSLDLKQDLADKELRRGHRAALRRFQQACSACQEVPVSLKGSDCTVCGAF